jgi:hypothetical protein
LKNNSIMKKIFLMLLAFATSTIIAQVGINTTSPSAMLHVYGTTVPESAGGTVNLINQDFTSYSVTQNHTNDTDCTGNATQGWVTGTGNTNVNCTSCTGTWLYISSDATGCGLNSTAIMNFTTAPTTTSITINFAYRYNYFSGPPDSFRVYLYNNTTATQVGANLINLTTDANTSYSGTAIVVAGNSYSLRFEYQGNYDYGASVDNVLVTETAAASPGTYSFRLEDGTQADGKVLTSDSNGNGYWKTPAAGGGTDNQTLSISGTTLSITNGNSITLPSGGSSYTFTNGLTNTSGTVKLGGALVNNTAVTLGTYDLAINASGLGDFKLQKVGADRFIFDNYGDLRIDSDTRTYAMHMDADKDFINFGSMAFPLSEDGTTFNDSGSSPYTIDFVLGADKGSSGGTAIQTGSIEFIVDGTAELFTNYSFSPLTNNSGNLGTSSHRWNTVYATNGTINTSDITLKNNIKPLNYGLKEILKLETISYNWKDNKIGKTIIPSNLQERKIGFSAQQLKTILPEVVQTHSWVPADENGNYKQITNEHLGVYYSDIIPVAVKAIQEQQVQIEELKSEIAFLKEAIDLLKKK